MKPDDKIFVAGHKGLVGFNFVQQLQDQGHHNLVFRSRDELDLTQQTATFDFFAQEKPDYVFLAAAKVGGIQANNTYRADFIYENLIVQCNVIRAAYENQCKRLLFLGSSCIYPRNCPQPMKEAYLLTGPLEQTNEPYAIAKIAGLKMCESFNQQYGTQFASVMPTNLYGQNDNFDPENSHVLPALLRRFHEAKQNEENHVIVWGTGTPQREFLHVEDMADACIFVMNQAGFNGVVNIGSGQEISIKTLAETIRDVVGFKGKILFDADKPDGTPRKLLDTSRLNALGWKAKISLKEGLQQTYDWFSQQSQLVER